MAHDSERAESLPAQPQEQDSALSGWLRLADQVLVNGTVKKKG